MEAFPSELIDQVRRERPVVLTLANLVTAGKVADALNALGASPIMSFDEREAAKMVACAQSIAINLGTITRAQEAQIGAVLAANANRRPTVLDPVAVASIPHRLTLARYRFTAIRGNASEIAALLGQAQASHGIDAGQSTGDLAALAQECARRYQTCVLLSGPVDYLSDGQQVVTNHLSTPLLATNVGSGDLLSSILAAYLTTGAPPLTAAALAMPTELIDQQFASLAADLKIRACKTGMLADAAHVHAVAENLRRYDFGPLTVDPVMIAKGGAPLLSEDAIAVVRDELLPLADLVTPNLPEAARLTGITIEDETAMQEAARALQALGAKNVLVKGGHRQAALASDYALLADGTSFWLTAPRVATKRTHGTGDTISACITAELAKGKPMATAIRTGKAYVAATIRNGIAVGHGHGPLNHWAHFEGDNNEL